MAIAVIYKRYTGSAWEELTFKPSSHSHTISEISDFPTKIDADTLDGKHASDFSSKEEGYKLTNYANVLQMLVEGSTINQEVEDNTKSYIKDVPYKSSSIAKIKEIGGMCYKINQLVEDSKHFKTITLTEETSKGFVRPLNNFIHSGNMTYLLGHKTLGLLKTSNNNLIVKNGANGRPIIGINEVTDAYFYNSWFYVYVYANSTIGAGTYTMDFMLVDLTAIYGKGKEPTTVAQFLEDYPMFNDYVSYNEGEVTETKVTSLDCVGANIWDEEWEVGSFDNTGQPIQQVSIRSKNFIKIISNTRYYFHSGSNNWFVIFFYDSKKNFISSVERKNNNANTPENAMYMNFRMDTSYGTTYNNDIAIIKGTSGTYTPYRHKNYPINESIQSLDGYGLGLNSSLYNYIDFENKKFIKKVGKYTFNGSEYWTYSSNGNRWITINLSGSLGKTNSNLLTNIPNIVNYGSTYDVNNSIYLGEYNGKITIQIADSTNLPSTMTSQEVNNYLKGKSLYYELKTPEEIDLSDILKDDAFIEVESKGTITFENEKQYAVPNNVMFFIKEEDSKPLIPTKTSQLTNDSNYVSLVDNLIPSQYLPSYVDDVLEYENMAELPKTGESGKIYIDKSTNKTYRWSGTTYVEISPSLALGETSSTAYAGDKGKANATAIATLQSYFNSDGVALRAVNDSVGNPITTTYVKKSGDSMSGNLTPSTNKGASLGTSSLYWNNIYGTTIYQNGNKVIDTSNIDSALSSTSTNPVQNKVVNSALNNKANSSDLNNYLAKNSAISVTSVTATGDIKSSTGKVSGVVVEGETLKENGKDISEIYQPIGDYALASAVSSLSQTVDTLDSDLTSVENDVTNIKNNYEKKKTTTTIFNTLTSLTTNGTAVGVFTTKSITLTDSVQAGDRLKVYLRGNSGYEQYCAGIIEFELYAPTSSKLVGSGMIMPTIGDQKFIVSASVTSTTSTSTSLSIVVYTLSARSGNTPAGANNVNVLKVERIR